MFNEVIYLITELNPTYDDDGFMKDAEEKRVKVFAECKSTTYKEYYEASRSGIQATEVFSINEVDYNNAIIVENGKKIKPSFVEYDGEKYRIVRRYKKGTVGNYVVELSCEEVE